MKLGYEIHIIYKTFLLLTTTEFLENDLVKFEKILVKKRVAYSKVKTHTILHYLPTYGSRWQSSGKSGFYLVEQSSQLAAGADVLFY